MASLAMFVPASVGSSEVYELRTYTTNEGKLDALHSRFRDHTVGLFKKHGMESLGYWVPTDGPEAETSLIYVLRHASRAAAKESWKAFLSDPQWRDVYKQSESNGPILAQPPESQFMAATAYSPRLTNKDGGDDAVFELRIYRTHPGKLAGLNQRFEDHTMRIFERHGMQSVGYWVPSDKPHSEDTLIYILRHKSRDAAKISWAAFGGDPEWKRVAVESQKDGRFLRERPEATYMRATDYSALR